MSSLLLERPGKWRWIAILATLSFMLFPVAQLLSSLQWTTGSMPFEVSFFRALLRSLKVAAGVVFVTWTVGTAAGTFFGLYAYRSRKILLSFLALPILVPSFIGALGLSNLRISVGLSDSTVLSGYWGSALCFAFSGIPLVTFVSLAALRILSPSQIQALRIHGGERLLVLGAIKSVAAISLVAAVFFGVLTLSDPGPGQILGFSGIAAEILISFSALYDFSLAAKQCLTLSVINLCIALPLVFWISKTLIYEILSKSSGEAAPRIETRASRIALFLNLAFVAICLGVPVAGMSAGLFRENHIAKIIEEVVRTIPNTLLYGTLAGLASTVFGGILALSMGRSVKLQKTLLPLLVAFLAFPSSLLALGFIQWLGLLPNFVDPVFRNRIFIGLAMGIKWVPLSTLFFLRSFGTSSRNWSLAAAVHGVSFSEYFFKILGPWLFPAALMAFFLSALFSTADVGFLLLLRPPGEDSLPISIFTIMANAPEALVSGLCLTYIGLAAILVIVLPKMFLRGARS
jgi:iron(III) transport system permease protein